MYGTSHSVLLSLSWLSTLSTAEHGGLVVSHIHALRSTDPSSEVRGGLRDTLFHNTHLSIHGTPAITFYPKLPIDMAANDWEQAM